MAYRRSRTPQTPAQKRTSAILCLILSIIIFVLGFYQRSEYNRLMSKCTKSVTGTVVDVDQRTKYRRRGRSYTEYQAKIAFEEDNAFGRSSVITPWARRQFYHNKPATVHFDPNDNTTYYIEGAAPDDGLAMMIAGGVLLVVGAVTFIQAKRMTG